MSHKVAVVTGASRGIGRAIAERLLKSGRELVAVARDAEKLAELARAYPGKVRTVSLDLAHADAVSALTADVAKRYARVDELVLAAGIVRYAAAGSVSESELRAQLDVNFVVPFLLTQHFGAQMKRAGQGAIVHVGSTLAFRSAPSTLAYAASKAALLSATRGFALEFAPHVRVNAVAPGVVDTEMVRVPRGTSSEELPENRESRIADALSRLTALHPLGRLGQPDDIADAVLYLLDASWVTGSVLTVDGGLTSA